MGYLYQCITNDGRESDFMKATSSIDAARQYTGLKTIRKAERKGNKMFWDLIVHKFDSENTNVAISENLYVFK